MEEVQTENAALASILETHIKPDMVDVSRGNKDSVQVLITHDPQHGDIIHSLKTYVDEYAETPDRKKGTASVDSAESFVELTNRHKLENSALFAHIDDTSTVAKMWGVINYHGGDETAQQFCDHKICYNFPFSEEFNAWNESNKKQMSQSDFAYFLEDRIVDVMVPGNIEDPQLFDVVQKMGGNLAFPEKMMSLASGLKVNVNEKVHQAYNTTNGETQIQFSHEHTDEKGAPVKVPNLFMIHIPIFDDGQYHEMLVRLRHRVKSGDVSWFYELYRPRAIVNKAFRTTCELAQVETQLPLFYGTPES